MTIYYSATTNAFYDSQVYNVNNIPEDKVAVAESTYKNLMAQQCAGRVIVAAADGTPTTIAQTCGPCTSTKYATKTELTNGLAAKANDSNVVHKTGDETINGVKSFGSVIKATNGTVQVGADTGYSVTFNYNGNITSKQARGTFNIFFPEGSGTLALTSDINGKANDSDVVHKTGDETIAGSKSFTEVLDRRNDVTTSTVATATQLVDTNANRCGWIANRMHWAGNYHVHNRHIAYNENSGKEVYIDIISGNNGLGGLFVGGTAINRNLNDVTSATDYTVLATMGWVNNPATSTNVVHRTGDETINGVKTFNSIYSNEINTKYFTYTHDNRTSYSYLPKTSGTLAIQERTRASAVVENRTLLYECAGGLDLGDITLNDMYTRFNALLIVYSNDDGGGISTYYLDCAELDIRRALAGSGSSATFLLVDGHSWWACTGASTGSKFVHSKNNGLRIHKIYGLAKYY